MKARFGLALMALIAIAVGFSPYGNPIYKHASDEPTHKAPHQQCQAWVERKPEFAGTPSEYEVLGTCSAPVELQEDDPGWSCATMGNRVCGDGPSAPVAVISEPTFVG